MALDFHLTYSNAHNTEVFELEGGPLRRTFNRIEWLCYVNSWNEGERNWFAKWADEAKLTPGVPVKRIVDKM